MRIDIITVLPEMLEGFVHESILARAEKKGLAEMRRKDWQRSVCTTCATTHSTSGAVLTTTPMVVLPAW